MKAKLIKGIRSPLAIKKTLPKVTKQRLSQRIKEHSLASMLPNFTTVMALCIGLSSVRFALLERWEMTVMAILIAAVLDAMDGRLARLLGSTSRFGAELDSFSDFINFGVSPALVMYLLSLQQAEGKGWAIVLFFSVCMALRLARFNTRSIEGAAPTWSQDFFTGVPAPAAACLAILPSVMYLEWRCQFLIHPLFVGTIMVVVGLLMISRVPTYSLKTVKIPHKWVRSFLLIVALLAAALFHEPWLTLVFIAAIYLISFPFSLWAYLKRRPKNL